MASAENPLYIPSPPSITPTTEDGKNLADWVQRELRSISGTFLDATALELRPIHSPPNNPREGMIVFADGTAWNPGFGKNSYEYINGLWVPVSNMGLRRVLTVATTYFVSTTGNDANDGSTVGTPWLTFAHAIAVLTSQIDFGGQDVTLQLADGTYTESFLLKPWTGGGSLTLQGHVGSTTSVLLNSASPQTINIASGFVGNFNLRSLKLQNSTAFIIDLNAPGFVTIAACEFAACPIYQILVRSPAGFIRIQGNITISGGASSFIYITEGGALDFFGLNTITASGTPAFSSFVRVDARGVVVAPGQTFSGAVTGSKFNVGGGGVISSGGGGPNYFPGSTPGVVNPGGLYT